MSGACKLCGKTLEVDDYVVDVRRVTFVQDSGVSTTDRTGLYAHLACAASDV
jgi:hypothetical protein